MITLYIFSTLLICCGAQMIDASTEQAYVDLLRVDDIVVKTFVGIISVFAGVFLFMSSENISVIFLPLP
jgi:hypothetical protein